MSQETEDRPIKDIIAAFDRWVGKLKDPQMRRDLEKLILYATAGVAARPDWEKKT